MEIEHVYRPAAVRKVPHKIRIGLALRGSISVQKIRRDLALARAYGLDPRQLYAECIEEILAGKGRANAFPQFTEVDPNQN
jgi:hypothetical protein